MLRTLPRHGGLLPPPSARGWLGASMLIVSDAPGPGTGLGVAAAAAVGPVPGVIFFGSFNTPFTGSALLRSFAPGPASIVPPGGTYPVEVSVEAGSTMRLVSSDAV